MEQQEQQQQQQQQPLLIDSNRFELWKEVRMQIEIAVPMICMNLLQYLVQVAAVMFVGHLGELSLASASLANSSCMVTGFSLMLGLASALETLCGQAYGAEQYHMLGIYLQRAVFVLNIASVPVAVMWYNMGAILEALGQEPELSQKAGEYAQWLIPGLFAYATVQAIVKYLQTQSALIAMAFCSLASILVHIPLCWLLLYKLQVGSKGAALSVSIAYWINAVLLILYVKFSRRCKGTWLGFSREAFKDLTGFFRLALPSAVMICVEYWSFEILTLLSGLLPNPRLETSTFATLLNTVSLLYMIPYGFGAAVSTRVSNELGAGNPWTAKAAVYVTLSMGFLDAVVTVSVLLLCRDVVGWAYSKDREVVAYVSELLPLASFIAFADPIQGVLTGVARGCGWQGIGAMANIGAYYIVGVPAAYVLAFVFKLKSKGLWIGIMCGIATQTVSLCVITFFTDWQKQARNAMERVSTASAKVDRDLSGGNGTKSSCTLVA